MIPTSPRCYITIIFGFFPRGSVRATLSHPIIASGVRILTMIYIKGRLELAHEVGIILPYPTTSIRKIFKLDIYWSNVQKFGASDFLLRTSESALKTCIGIAMTDMTTVRVIRLSRSIRNQRLKIYLILQVYKYGEFSSLEIAFSFHSKRLSD